MKIIIAMFLTLTLVGCSRPAIILHPISTLDIQRMPEGQPYTPEKDGYFLSDKYLELVVDVKVAE